LTKRQIEHPHIATLKEWLDFTPRGEAGGVVGDFLPALSLSAWTFGQMPTIAATSVMLFALARGGAFLRSGCRASLVQAVALAAVARAAHHGAFLLAPFAGIAIVLRALASTRRDLNHSLLIFMRAVLWASLSTLAVAANVIVSAAFAWGCVPQSSKPQLRSAVMTGALVAMLTALPLRPYWLTCVEIGDPANSLERASLLERSLLMGYGMDAWRAQPLTGVGAGGLVQWAARHMPEPFSLSRYTVRPVGAGGDGDCGRGRVRGGVGCFLRRVWSRRKVRSAAEAVWAAALLGIGVTSLFDHFWWTQPPVRTLFAMAVALWVVESDALERFQRKATASLENIEAQERPISNVRL
jgi:hypothetical protein